MQTWYTAAKGSNQVDYISNVNSWIVFQFNTYLWFTLVNKKSVELPADYNYGNKNREDGTISFQGVIGKWVSRFVSTAGALFTSQNH